MRQYTVLIVDYEPRSVERTKEPLVAAGFKVETAADGVAGIEAFHRLRPDLVLIEAMIPKKHGFEVCQELKKTPDGKGTPIVITTAVYKGRKYRTQALHLYGADDYIEKPVEPVRLVELARRLVDRPSEHANASVPAPAAEPAPAASGAEATAVAAAEPSTGSQKKKKSVVGDLTEDEIIARLDAILPSGDPDEGFGESLAVPPSPASTPIAAPAATAGATALAAARAEPSELDPPGGGAESPGDDDVAAELERTIDGAFESLTSPPPQPPAEPERDEEDSVDEADEDDARVVRFDASRSKRKDRRKTPPPADEAPEAEPAEEPLAAEPPAAKVETAEGEGDVAAAEPAPARSWRWVAAIVGLLLAGAAVGWFLWMRGGSAVPRAETAPPVDVAAARVDRDSAATAPESSDDASAAVAVPIEEPVSPRTAADTTLPLGAGGAPGRKLPAEPAGAEPVAKAETKPSSPPAPPAAATGDAIRESPRRVETAPRPEPEAAPASEPPKPEEGPSAEGAAASASAETAPREAEPDPAPVEANPTVAVGNGPIETPPAKPNSLASNLRATVSIPGSPDPLAVPSSREAAGSSPASSGDAPSTPPRPKAEAGSLWSIAEVDREPVSLNRTRPGYTARARAFRHEGTVTLQVLVDHNGRVEDIRVVQAIPGSDLDRAAVDAVRKWTYEPATKDGVPVKTWKTERIVFQL